MMSPLDYPPGPIVDATVEIDMNAAGQTVYRHVLTTEWQVAPEA